MERAVSDQELQYELSPFHPERSEPDAKTREPQRPRVLVDECFLGGSRAVGDQHQPSKEISQQCLWGRFPQCNIWWSQHFRRFPSFINGARSLAFASSLPSHLPAVQVQRSHHTPESHIASGYLRSGSCRVSLTAPDSGSRHNRRSSNASSASPSPGLPWK